MKPTKRDRMPELPELQKRLYEDVTWNHDGEAIPELVGKGVEIDFVHPKFGHTALYNACQCDRPIAIEMLLQHGADPNRRFTYHSPVDGRVEADRVALHYASSPEAVAALIGAGADVNATDAVGTTPLMCAAFHGHTGAVRALLAAGASPTARQQKRRGRKSSTAREMAESKARFWRKAVSDENREAAESRLRCYEEIRDTLLGAESRSTAV